MTKGELGRVLAVAGRQGRAPRYRAIAKACACYSA